MPHTLDQILPSLQALGLLGYWLIGLASALEAFFLTGVVVPGTLIVDAGGILVQRGLLDFFDLVWFVALGSILGSEASYWTGRLAMHRLPGRGRIEGSATFARAIRLFEKRGGAALVIGRFLGPVAGLVPLAAAIAGMERRRFVIWNVIGSIPYALAHVAIGFFLGDVLGRISGSLTRVALLVGIVAILLIVLWGLLYSALRLAPLALAILSAALRGLTEYPAAARRLERHPGFVRWIEARLDRTTFTGLPLSLLGALFLYIGVVWLDSAIDFLSGDPMLQFDGRLAELLHHFQSPVPIRIASFVTAFGGWHVVAPLVAATLAWLAIEVRRPLVAGLLVSVLGNTATVALLKFAFARPRSPLGYFAETSGSFPSGHAAASVAAYGMVMYVFWRAGRLRAETAVLAAGLLAFGIGASRIYLVEHYLSDVLNGWLVGAIWLTLGIAVSEWLASHPRAERNRLPDKWRIAAYAAIIALVGLGAANAWRHDDPRNPQVSTADILLANPQDLANAADFQVVTESLLGSPLRPVSLIVLAADDMRLIDAMRAANWTESRPPGPGLIVDAFFSAIEGREDPTVETVSHFWRGRPNDLAFGYHPDPSAAPGHDPKARFWRSEYVTADGLRAYVGTVGLDEVGEPTIADPGPDDPASRDAVAQGLLRSGATEVARIDLARAEGDSGAIRTAVVLRLP